MDRSLEDYKKDIETAISRFNAQTEEMKSLRDSLTTELGQVQKMVLDLKARGENPLTQILSPGFSDEKMAKEFIQFTKDVVQGNNMGIKDTYGIEGTDEYGGYLVPDTFQPTLVRLIEVYGMARRLCNVIPMQGKVLTMPTLVSGVNVYWVSEGSAITTSRPVFGTISLTPKKLAALTPFTSELAEDSSIAIANLYATLIAEALAQEEDRVAFVGDTGEGDAFTGVMWDSNTNAVFMDDSTMLGLDADDLNNMIAAVPKSALPNARFLMHRTILHVVQKLKDNNNNYIWMQPSGSQPGTIWGYPYETSDVMPSTSDDVSDWPFVVFGNFKHHYMGDRRRLGFAISDHYKFNLDMPYLRATERIAFTVGIPDAFSVLYTAAGGSSTTTTA